VSDWQPPTELPDLRRVGIIALDTETFDEGLREDRGSAWPWRGGYICGLSIAWRDDSGVRAHCLPLRHPDSENFPRENVARWLKDLLASDVRIVTQNGLYDWGWLLADLDLRMPPAERLEEIGALATLVDENRFKYSLDALCQWRGLPSKDETKLLEGITALGLHTSKRKKLVPQNYIHNLPARYVGPYAEADAANTLALFESLDPILDQEGTRGAYRLEVDLLPMVLEMRRRGIRVDQSAAEQARDNCLQKRDRALIELSERLGSHVSMTEIASPRWKADTFDAHAITYPRTAKGHPSFKAGKTGWMAAHSHWLPRLIATASKYNFAGSTFLEGHILGHLIGERIYGEINPHRSGEGGTRSFRFSYSDPPLQQMPSRDKELGPLIRSVFLPENDEIWCTVDCSQQEFRLVVHHAIIRNLPGAKEAAERYQNDPDTDFHALAGEITGIPRDDAKAVNFAKIYGAGPEKFAEMIGKPLDEAEKLRVQYDQQLPFVAHLDAACRSEADQSGCTLLYDGARRHWDLWAPRGDWQKGPGPCERAEAIRRVNDPGHPWYGQRLRRARIHTALNAQIQGDAARHTKLWMRAVFREGIVPLLQMHDGLELSVATREQGELVARLACEAVKLKVPMRTDITYGRTWGDAKHDWAELHCETAPTELAPVQVSPTASKGNWAHPLEIAVDTVNTDTQSEPADEAQSAPDELQICVFCRSQIATGSDRASSHHGGGLHMHCVDPFLHQRTAAEGIPQKEPHHGEDHDTPEDLFKDVPPRSPTVTQSAAATSVSSRTASTHQGNGASASQPPPGGSKAAAAVDTFAQDHADEPFDDLWLCLQGYRLARVYEYTLPDGTLLYQQNRYELPPGHVVTKRRPKKRFLPHRIVNGREVFGGGDRRVLYNWPAVMRAGPGATVIVTEGEKNADALIAAGILATTVLSHKWAPECITALNGRHLIILEDHDESGRKLAADATAKLSPVAASVRVVPYSHLWQYLDPAKCGAEPTAGEDVSDWFTKGGDPAQLLDICREILVDGAKIVWLDIAKWDSEPTPDLDWAVYNRIPLLQVFLLSGIGGAGKSTIQLHECVAQVLGLDWFGAVPVVGPAIFIDAEDAEKILHRRLKEPVPEICTGR
jgi:DNA polymerase I-like protein with 3'-5' exonuclease and polymerase domains